jgi:hypothetical protein
MGVGGIQGVDIGVEEGAGSNGGIGSIDETISNKIKNDKIIGS